MSYLISSDYKKVVQAENLLQVTGSDLSILSGIELLAQAEAISYLTQKYDTSVEFTDTLVFNPAVSYKAGQRVYLDGAAYSATATYTIDDIVVQNKNVYICTTAVTSAEAFDPNKWELLGAQYKIFYVTLPKQAFDYMLYYSKGDEVYWKNKTYICQIASVSMTHEAALQLGTYSNEPLQNVFPDDPVNGQTYWGAGTAYSVTAGTLPTDTSKWTAGDNRSQQLVSYCCDIALYHVHSRIAPRNIPELRVKRYDDAIEWLKAAGQGKITAALPLIQPKRGRRVRFGGNVKNQNSY